MMSSLVGLLAMPTIQGMSGHKQRDAHFAPFAKGNGIFIMVSGVTL